MNGIHSSALADDPLRGFDLQTLNGALIQREASAVG